MPVADRFYQSLAYKVTISTCLVHSCNIGFINLKKIILKTQYFFLTLKTLCALRLNAEIL